MWIMLPFGMFSAVCAKPIVNGVVGGTIDPHRIMVRARMLSHLTALRAKFPELLADSEIVETPHNDYAGRIYMYKEVWAQIVASCALAIAYGNFKDEVKRVNEYDDPYGSTLDAVWGVLYHLQEKVHGFGIFSRDNPARSVASAKAYLTPRPRPSDRVVVVFSGPSWEEPVGVIWHPNLFGSSAEAYSAGLSAHMLDLVSHPRFEPMTWEEATTTWPNATIYNPKARTKAASDR